MAAKKLTFGAASSCSCKNLCNRSTKRGACPCLSQELYCSAECSCGTAKQECLNRYGKGGALDSLLGIQQQKGKDSDDDESMILIVGNEEGHVSLDVSALDTSIQAAAEREFPVSGIVNPIREFSELTTEECDPSGMFEDLTLQESKLIFSDIFAEYPQLVSFMKRRKRKDPPSPPPNNSGPPQWCKCGRCREMPTQEEQHCCRTSVGKCILVTAATAITNLMDRNNLVAAVHNRNDLFALNDDINSRETLRHTTYRQFVLWRHGRLGAGNRVVIPSCVVWRIRNTFPDQSGQYTGFRSSRFN